MRILQIMKGCTIQEISEELFSILNRQLQSIVAEKQRRVGLVNRIIQLQKKGFLDNICEQSETQISRILNLCEQNQYLRSALEMMQDTIEQLRDNMQNQSRSSFYSTHTKKQSLQKQVKEGQESQVSTSQLEQQIMMMSGQLRKMQQELLEASQHQKVTENYYECQIRRLKQLALESRQISLSSKQIFQLYQVRQNIHKVKRQLKLLKQMIEDSMACMKKEVVCQIMLLYQNKLMRDFNPGKQSQISGRQFTENENKMKKTLKKSNIADLNKKFELVYRQNHYLKDRITKILKQ